MEYRTLGRTGLRVSEIGLGGEWFNGLTAQESAAIIDAAQEKGINYIDIFMPQAPTRSNLGVALEGRREKFIIQGHLCTVFEDGQYTRTRDIEKTRRSFEDLLERLHTDYIDVGMIHYVDSEEDFRTVFEGPVLSYAKVLKENGVIRHIGMSSHNPHIALKAVESVVIDVLMFSINPAYDMEAAETDIYDLMEFKGMEKSGLVVDEARQKLYSACEAAGVAITVMKPLGAGTLLKAESSPLRRGHDGPPVHPILPGPQRRQGGHCGLPHGGRGAGGRQILRHSPGGAELLPYLQRRKRHLYDRSVHVLQPLPALPCPHQHCGCNQVPGSGRPAGFCAGDRGTALLVPLRHG